MEVTTSDLLPIREKYSQGMYLQAYELSKQFGPLEQWENTPARLMGGRIAIQLGGNRLGRKMHLQAWKDTPTYPEAIYYHARYRLEQFGPFACWNFMRTFTEDDWSIAPPDIRADWYALHAYICGRLRDFEQAERWLNKADTLCQDRAWFDVEKSAVLEFQEKYEEALEVARHSLQLVPNFRPGVQSECHLLLVLGRTQEALERLREASQAIESSILYAHLAAVQMELRHFHDARATYEKFVQFSPLLDRETKKWTAARLADVAYYCGDFSTALEQCPHAKDEFYDDLAKQLPLVSQPEHYHVRIPCLTLGEMQYPSPLDVGVRYWLNKQVNCPQEVIASDGLPDVREREWVEAQGLVCREFRFAPEIAKDLLSRGLPFTLTLFDGGYGHPHLVVGVDMVRQSLLFRDIYENRDNEASFKLLNERYQGTGPRGLLFVPPEKVGELEGIEFPDGKELEKLHQLQLALHQHRRAEAVSIYDELRAESATHLVTRLARLALARYDAHPVLMDDAIDALLTLAPNDSAYLSVKLNTLRELSRKDERLQLAQKLALSPKVDPSFSHQYVHIALADPELLPDAEMVMRRTIRKRPYYPGGYYLLANVLWERGEFDLSREVYRFSAALDDRDDQFCESYYRASRATSHNKEALRFLEHRYHRTLGRWSAPARVYFYALSEEGEMDEAFDCLRRVWEPNQETEATPPMATNASEVGDVILFAAEMHTNYNDAETGEQLLELAKKFSNRLAIAKVETRIEMTRLHFSRCQAIWNEILAAEPLSNEAHRNVARLIADLRSRDEAIEWLKSYIQTFPHHYPLRQLLIDWLRGETVAQGVRPPAETVIREMIEQCPTDAWIHRELSLHLANAGFREDALVALEEAKRLEPDSPSYFYTLGHVLTRADRIEEAREAYQEIIRRSVDNDIAIAELLTLSPGDEEKKNAIEFVADQFQLQQKYGEGILTFRDTASQAGDVIEPDELLKIVQQAYDEYPEVWQTWSALSQQLVDAERIEEAHQVALEAVERFPLLPRLWKELADIRKRLGKIEDQIAALRQAVITAPGWSYVARELADLLEVHGDKEEARAILEQAVARNPIDPGNHGYLADHLWKIDEPEEALRRQEISVTLDPGYDWAWRTLGEWCDEVGRSNDVVEIARRVTKAKPGDPRGWLALARWLYNSDQHEELLHALDRCITLNPRGTDGHDLKAERLAELGRFDEAKAAALPDVYDNDIPILLQGRAAWVEAKRGDLITACREMQALVALEPTYYWGWQQLAEWYNLLGRSEDFLEAANKMVSLRPDNPFALTARGEARMQNEDLEGAKEDFRASMHLDPNYTYPGMLLFDALMEDKDYGAARGTLAILDENAGSSGRPYVVARYVQLYARSGEKDDAFDEFEEVITLPCESSWPISSSAAELRKAGWQEHVDGLLKHKILTTDNFQTPCLLAWLDSPMGTAATMEERLEVVRRVIKIHPTYVTAHDLKAELLCQLERFDEALAACKPEALEDQLPMMLLGREAWIYAQRGNRTEAIKKMRLIVETEPDYDWGWKQLAIWYDENQQPQEYLEAAEHWSQLRPNDPVATSYLADALQQTGDRRRAKANFRKAYETNPAYAFPGLNLFDFQLDDEEFDAASLTLTKLQEHVGGPQVQLRQIQLLARQKNEDEAMDALYSLLLMEDAPNFMLTRSLDALRTAGYHRSTLALLAEAMEDNDIHPATGRLWVEESMKLDDWAFCEKLLTFETDTKASLEAVATFLDNCRPPHMRDKLYEFLEKAGSRVRSSNTIWAKVSASLLRFQDFAMIRTWGADWRERDLDEQWQLHAYATALRVLDETEELVAVCHFALNELEEDGYTTCDFQVWLLFEAANSGNVELATQLREAIQENLEEDEDYLDSAGKILYQMALGLLQVKQQGGGAFGVAKADGRQKYLELAGEVPRPDMVRSYKRWAKNLASSAGGILPRLWFWFRGNPPQ
ncbi:MAG: tetratricopeptide repeat protein [Zavarzinella sp.]